MRLPKTCISILLAAIAASAPSQTGALLRVKGGLVVSDSALASNVGAEILKKGGNAVDAAVATGFALAVTFPSAGNLGGGGFLLLRLKSGESVFVDYRERAPKAATRDMYLDKSGKPVPGMSTIGYKAVGVPGTVAGMWEAHKRFGRLPWKDLVEPARRLADEGFPVEYGLSRGLRAASDRLRRFPESWRIFCREGKFYEWGETFRQPELAATLARIQSDGAKGFYEGETARLIAEDMKANGGLITPDDLRDYRVAAREPAKGSFRGYEVLSAPPPSSGGVALITMLNILEGYDLRSLGPGSSGAMHLMVEAMKRAFADRAAHLGDPDFGEIPVKELIDKDYAAGIRRQIDPTKATPSKSIRTGLNARGPAILPPFEREHTTHFSVVDADGNAVSNTYTINDSYGCGATVKGAGFLLNNEMDDFAIAPGVPNTYGLIQGEANSIAPGKRPLSSMTPTIVHKDGQVFLVLGSPGGPTIINTVLQTILNVLDFGMSVQAAVSAPRVHHQWLPDEIRWETLGLNSDARLALQKMGHVFARFGTSLGSCHAIFVDPATSHRIAGVDPRISTSGAAGH